MFQYNHICQDCWKNIRSKFECMFILKSRGKGAKKGMGCKKKVCKKTHWCLGLQQRPQIKGGRRERRRRKKRLYTICGQFLYNLHTLKCTIPNEKQYEFKDMNLIFNGNIKEKYIFYIHARKKETPPSEFYR